MRTIAIIDSDPLELDRFSQMLEEENYQILTASGGTQAKALVSRRASDITAVVMDWSLSDVEGLELLAWTQAQAFAADLEVIIHAEAFSPEDIEHAIEAGAYYFLTKPFDGPQVEAIVRAAVESVEQRRKLERLVRETRDAVRLLTTGVFRLRTIDEAELLAIHLASASGHNDLGLALRELLVNAVEHGNLGITYEEKGRLLADHCLRDECTRRLRLQQFKDRRVEVTLERRASDFLITIQDEGEGFDFERFATISEERLFDLHGRGVLIAAAALDLEYVPPGNRVKIRLPSSPPSTSS